MGNGFGRHSVVARIGGADERETLVSAAGAGGSARDPAGGAGFSAAAAGEKYQLLAEIGAGGMGEVVLVHDADLRRDVAMKLMREDMAKDPVLRRKFVAEAQATSQLEHPGIPPVHDIGITPEGRVYFTMKVVRGETLGDVLKKLVLGAKDTRRTWNLHKLASTLERVCEALHFAHEQGIVHRDLKPENLMLGEFGEVHVMDWGIAKVEPGAHEADEYEDDFGEDTVHTIDTDEAPMTQVGTIKGTIPYMSPEQARGETLDRRSDLYALGAVLYEVLTLQPAYTGGGMELLRRVQAGEHEDVATRNPRRPVPEPLAELCRQAMAPEPAARPQTAREFAEALRAWLDGRAERARKHKEAEALAAQGVLAVRRYEQLTAEIDVAEAVVTTETSNVKPWQPREEKRALYAANHRLADLRTEVALAFADATRLFDAALVAEEQNATARAALADLWHGRHVAAEREGNRPDAAYAETMIRRHDDGRLAAYLAGDGSLELRSDPPGADVTLIRFEDDDGVLVEGEERSLGTTPVARLALPMGSYLCILRQAGFRDVRYPVHITRSRAWKGTVRMRTEAEIPEEFVYVPGGPFVYGEGKDTTTEELPDFLIKKTPVTFREYAEYLAALEAEAGEDAVAERMPRTETEGTILEREDDGTYRIKPAHCDGATGEIYDRDHARLPVFAISWHDAVAYCRWKTRVTGREWRLPTEQEREKAARGVDGRRFPWGDAADASLCKNSGSRSEPTQPEPVGAFPSAASVYGMLDAGGGIWDWTSSLWEPLREASAARVVRGGSWNYPVTAARAAFRSGSAAGIRNATFGFRPAGSVTT